MRNGEGDAEGGLRTLATHPRLGSENRAAHHARLAHRATRAYRSPRSTQQVTNACFLGYEDTGDTATGEHAGGHCHQRYMPLYATVRC